MAYRVRISDPRRQRLNATRRVVARLQEVLGDDRKFDLPGIIVVGSQSVGKSSLLEAVSGIRLPSGPTLCTKCPLQLEMYNSQTTSYSISYEGRPAIPIGTLEEVTRAIEQATEQVTGGNLKFVDSLITVKICSPDACDLTVIDLPGIIGSPPTGYPPDSHKTVLQMAKNYTRGENKIICLLLLAYQDAGGQSKAHEVKVKRDPQGQRTVGVLTKADVRPADGTTRQHVSNTIQGYPLRHGYIAVRTRLDTEATLTEAEVRAREADFFQSSADFAEPAPCGTGVGSLIDKLEELQWQMYSGSCIPFVQRELDDQLFACRKKLAELAPTVDSQQEALTLLTDRLGKVANEAKAATSPNESALDPQLCNVDALRFGRKFRESSEKFINTVNSGPADSPAASHGLPAILWSQYATDVIRQRLSFLDGAVLRDSGLHPEIPGLVFQQVVHPNLASPAQRLVDDLRTHVRQIFQTVLEFVYKHWLDVVPIVMREVDDILQNQAIEANKAIAESIEALTGGFHYTFNKRYEMTKNAFLADTKAFNENPLRTAEELQNMVFESLPFLQILFPSLKALGGVAGLMKEMTGQAPPGAALPAAASVVAGQVGISQEHFAQICFAVYSQIVLDRVFDDIPLLARMFLVQRVHLLLERKELDKRLGTEKRASEIWALIQAGQSQLLEEKQNLTKKILELEQCSIALANPTATLFAEQGPGQGVEQDGFYTA